MPDGEKDRVARLERFVCPGCGAEQRFDAAAGRLRCDFCGATREVPRGGSAVVEHALTDGLVRAARGLGASGLKVALCQECGARVAFSGGATAQRCAFCGTAKVLDQTENTLSIRPESLVPFSIDAAAAQRAFASWLRSRWFRPSDLKRRARLKELVGVYVPFWTFDAHVESSWRAQAGYFYYTTEPYSATEEGRTVVRERQVQHTRWEPAAGARADDFDDVLVCASGGLPSELAARLATFDTTRLVPYAPGYLAGFRAEEYAVDLDAGFALGRAQMEAEQTSRCAEDVPGDTHRFLQAEHALSQVTFKHVLLPIWISAYRYRERVYRFLVNGQTGEVVGAAPLSVVKVALFVAALILLAAVLILWLHPQPTP